MQPSFATRFSAIEAVKFRLSGLMLTSLPAQFPLKADLHFHSLIPHSGFVPEVSDPHFEH